MPRLVDTPQRSAPFAAGSVIGIKPSALAPYSPSVPGVTKSPLTPTACPKPTTASSRSRRSAAIAAEQAIADTSKATDDVVDDDGEEVVLKRDPQIRDEADSDFDDDSEEEAEDEEDHDFKPDFHKREAQRVSGIKPSATVAVPAARPAAAVAPLRTSPVVNWTTQETDILMTICM